MGVIIPEDFYQASFIWTVAGNTKEKVATLGFAPVLTGPTDPTDCADELYTIMTTSGHPGAADVMIDEWTFQGVSVIQGTSSGPIVGQHIDAITGTVTGMSIPTNSAVLVKKNTALGGRKNRGRLYWPPVGLTSSNCDSSGAINPTLVGIYQTMWDAVLSGMGAADLLPMLLHSDATTPTPITSFSVESSVATQRRRIR